MTAPLSDDEFLAAFFDCSLPPDVFNHRAHLRVAWLILNRSTLDDAIEHICTGIQKYATHLGAAQKYHRTVSEFLVRLMALQGAGTSALSFDEFMRTNPELTTDVRGILARHYSAERLDNSEARQHFVAPDRIPLSR